jgi:hypothetical protein
MLSSLFFLEKAIFIYSKIRWRKRMKLEVTGKYDLLVSITVLSLCLYTRLPQGGGQTFELIQL